MITSYIRIQEINEGGIGYKSIPVQFPDNEDYDGIELIDEYILNGDENEEGLYSDFPGICSILNTCALAACTLEHPEQAADPSVITWAKSFQYRIDFHNAQQQ